MLETGTPRSSKLLPSAPYSNEDELPMEETSLDGEDEDTVFVYDRQIRGVGKINPTPTPPPVCYGLMGMKRNKDRDSDSIRSDNCSRCLRHTDSRSSSIVAKMPNACHSRTAKSANTGHIEVINGGSSTNGRMSQPYYLLYQIMGRLVVKLVTSLAEFALQLTGFIQQTPGYQIPLIFILLFLSSYGAYSLFLQLGYTLAAICALVGDCLWPLLNFILSAITCAIRWLGCWAESVQELVDSLMCDWAQLWCDEFRLLCHRRCGFAAKAWMKGRGGARCGV